MSENPTREDLERRVASLQRELSALKRGAASVLVHQGFEEAARAVFDVCKEVVGATSGYVALSTPDGRENELVYLDSGGAPCTVDTELPMPIRGLRARASREARAVFHNDFSNSQWTQYLPEGHLHLKNVLFAPLIIDDKAVGLLGLANKATDFTPEDADIASVLGEFAAIALRNAKSEDDRNRFAHSLIESEDRFHKLYSTMNEGVGLHELVYDRGNHPVDYRVLDVNPKYEEITGLEKDELVGKTGSELYGPVQAPYFDRFVRVAESGEAISFESYWLPMDKHLLVSAFSPAKGQFATVFTDITERKKAEDALKENRLFLQGVFDAIQDGITVLDRDLNIVRVNAWVEETFASEATAVGEKCYDLYRKKSEPCPDCPTLKVLADGKRRSAVIPYPSDEAPASWYNVSVFPLKDPGGRITGVIEYFKDVTKETIAERELRRAHDELEQRVRERTEELRRRNEQLSRLSSELTLAEQRERSRVAEVIHDQLQQLLVSAKLRLEMLSSKVGDNHWQAAEDVRGLIVEALQGSRSLAKELSAPVLYESGLVAALEWLALWLKEHHGLTVRMDLDENTTPTREDVKVLLYQSVRELLLNVVKHAGASTARVRMTRSNENHLKIAVEDSGVGFDPDERWKNEDLFSGFGLFSIRERLDLLGGRLEVDSSPGMGSTFTLLVPMEAKAPESRHRVPRIAPATREEEAAAGRAQTLRVLLVDDHAVMRQGLASLLEGQEDIEVAGEAADGSEAVDLARTLRPDVILMDINMPGMNGIEATRIIHSESPGIRILGLSINEEAASAGPIKEAGAEAYLSKSSDSATILQAIRRVKA